MTAALTLLALTVALAGFGIVATARAVARDGYRATPTDPARALPGPSRKG